MEFRVRNSLVTSSMAEAEELRFGDLGSGELHIGNLGVGGEPNDLALILVLIVGRDMRHGSG